MSSPNHPTSDIQDAFSSNSPDYISASLDYFATSPGSISPDSSNDLTKYLLTSLAILPYHNDSYIIQAYDAIPPPQAIIAVPAVLPLSSVLSLPSMFDSRDFFSSKKISPPKDTKTPVKSPIPVSPSSSVGSSSPNASQKDINICSTSHESGCHPQLYRGLQGEVATVTLTEEALSWWNSFAQPICIEETYKIIWVEFKKLLIKKYCPRTKIQKMEDEFYHLTVKGNDLKTYVRGFQKLGTLCPTMVLDYEKLLEAFIRGLP
nr:reverse transcriptase domain-containing protein [Tanacetum cinerariifolium]